MTCTGRRRFHVLIDEACFHGQAEHLQRLLNSLDRQTGSCWTRTLVPANGDQSGRDDGRTVAGGKATSAAHRLLSHVREPTGVADFTVFIDAPVSLDPDAIELVRARVDAAPQTIIAIVNERWLAPDGTVVVTAKAWDAARVADEDIFGPIKIARTDRLLQAAAGVVAPDEAWGHATLRTVAERGTCNEVLVIPAVATRPGPPTGPRPHRAESRVPIRRQRASHRPRATVIIPTRDQTSYLRTAVEGVLTGTDYPALDLIVVDNGSETAEARSFLAGLDRDPRARVVHDPRPFNFSQLNNDAARLTDAETLVFLNNDVEIRDPAWLDHMVEHCSDPRVGAVGSLLLYPDGTIQHAGIRTAAADGALAAHVHAGLTPEIAFGGPPPAAQDVTAATAACLAIRRDVFDAFEGFDTQLAVSYNDVDLCLRLRRAGLRVVCQQAAPLVHHESKSRGADTQARNRARALAEHATLARRWGGLVTTFDPYSPPHSHGIAENATPA
jgi:GT2 family glycosyltransferase